MQFSAIEGILSHCGGFFATLATWFMNRIATNLQISRWSSI